MPNNVRSVSSVTPISPEGFAAGGDSSQHRKPSVPDAARYRLTIEEGPNGFVYKTLDRVTGEVIRQFPREEVLKLKVSPTYDRGGVFDIRA
jgi:flagellar protein FlaG